MAETVQKGLEDWCTYLSNEETEQYMKALGLRVDGQRFAKLERLSQWLSGNYEPSDFIAEPDIEGIHAQWVHRENMRTTFMDRASGSNPDISWVSANKDEQHPLEILKADPGVVANLEQSRPWVASEARDVLDEDNASYTGGELGDDKGVPRQERRNAAPNMLPLQQSDGATFQIPNTTLMWDPRALSNSAIIQYRKRSRKRCTDRCKKCSNRE